MIMAPDDEAAGRYKADGGCADQSLVVMMGVKDIDLFAKEKRAKVRDCFRIGRTALDAESKRLEIGAIIRVLDVGCAGESTRQQCETGRIGVTDDGVDEIVPVDDAGKLHDAGGARAGDGCGGE